MFGGGLGLGLTMGQLQKQFEQEREIARQRSFYRGLAGMGGSLVGTTREASIAETIHYGQGCLLDEKYVPQEEAYKIPTIKDGPIREVLQDEIDLWLEDVFD